MAAARELYPTVESIDQMMERVKAHLDAEEGERGWTEERYLLVTKTAREARCQGKDPQTINNEMSRPPTTWPPQVIFN